MCVKTRRLDVAIKCLGQMGNIRAANSLRSYERKTHSSTTGEKMSDAAQTAEQLGLIASHLGMVDEAKKLFVD